MNDFLGGSDDTRQESSRRRIEPVSQRPAPQQRPSYEQRPISQRQPAYSNSRPSYEQRPVNQRPAYQQHAQRSSVGMMPPSKKKKGLLPGWLVIAIDLVLIGVFLIVYALFHHVLPQKPQMDPVTLPNNSVQDEPVAAPDDPVLPDDPAVSDDPAEPSKPVEPEDKFADKFTSEVVHTDKQYSNDKVNISVETFNSNGVTYHVADIYVKDVQYIKTAFPDGNYGKRGWVYEIGAANNAFVAINGDQGPDHKEGVIVRNGELYRESPFRDIAVLGYDGYLYTYTEEEFDVEKHVKQDGAWQAWAFGPVLLTNGEPMEEFNTDVAGANPRTAIGMIEPLHYLFVTVDGRGESAGLSMKNLSQLMYDLGCTTAYNLDGGGTAVMAVDGKTYSTQSKDRTATDIIYVPMD